MWRQLKFLDPPPDSGITTLEVPSDGDLTTPHCKTCTSWSILTDPREIERALICRNRLHFGQAHGTLPTIPPFSTAVDWHASTTTSMDILHNNLPFADELDTVSAQFLHQFQLSTTINSITAELSLAEWSGKMKVWRETTSTSPSGMHLGHHKALLVEFPDEGDLPLGLGQLSLNAKRLVLLQSQIDLFNYAIRHSYTYQRWHKVATFMIKKDFDSAKIHRLRVIHLYEADLNLLLGVKWRSLIHHCVDNSLLNPGQFGGLPGRDAMTPVFLEELQWETTRASRRSLLRMDFDASSCYDRIIPCIASLAARSFGQHQALCFIHASFLQNAQYYLKTKLGLSDDAYSHCKLHPIYGTGQGSANSPVIWALISSKLFDAQAATAFGATFLSPDRSHQLQIFMIGFVDDTNAGVNNFAEADQSPTLLLQRASSDAQLWHDLLCRSGGALEISKCAYHLAYYSFSASGAPVLSSLPPNSNKVCIQEHSKSEPTSLKYLSPFSPRKTLGCYKSPSPNVKASLDYIATIATTKSKAVMNSSIDAKSAWRYYFAVFLPSVTYSLPTNVIPERQLQTLQNATVRPILNKMGYPKSLPHAIVYGPTSLGGLGLRSFYDEQGSTKMELVLKHLRSNTLVTTQVHIALAWCQRLCGTSLPILEFPSRDLPHLETTFFPSLRQYLADTSSSLILEHTNVTPIQRVGDFHLMDSVLNSGVFSSQQIRWINYCRVFLQVHTIADMTTAGGTHVDPGFINGSVSLLSSQSTELEPIQERPTTAAAWRSWKKACSLWCNVKTGKLFRPLGKWLHSSPTLRRSWPYHWDPVSGRLLVRQSASYTAHRPFIRGPRGTRFHYYSNRTLLTLPPSCFPTDALEYRLGFTRLSTKLQGTQNAQNITTLPTCSPFASNNYAPTTTILPPITSPPHVPLSYFHKTLSQQPPWIQHLLPNLQNNLPYPDIFSVLLDVTTNPTAACDGSVLESQGTFGWVLATSNPPRTLLSCSGPAYGHGMDSFRAEAYGILSLVTMLHLLSTQANQPLPPISIWCDNQAVVNTVNKITHRKRPTFPSDTVRPSWDILQAVCTQFRQHPNLTIQHVKGHQDLQGDVRDLPLPAKLNIEADKLATSFQHRTSHVEDRGPMIPGTGCHLCINKQVIPSHQRHHIRARRGTRALLKYIQQKHNLTGEAIGQIEWDGHCNAVKAFRQKSSTFTTKFLSKWLPVGKQTHRYNPTIYTSRCPSCDCAVEDFQHAFCCPARQQWQSSLRDDLLKAFQATNTDQVLQQFLLQGMNHWFRDTPLPPTTTSERYNPLVESQGSIGWHQLIFGRWSQLWGYYQLQHLQRHNIPINHNNHGVGWTSKLILIIWSHFYEEWTTRNQALHGSDKQSWQNARRTKAEYKIRSLYKLREKCARSCQLAWFYQSADEHFQREKQVSSLENWISLNETRIMAHVASQKSNRRQGQHSLTDFFPIQPPGKAPDPAPNIDPIPPNLVSSTNAPPTCGPGGFAGDELRAHR
jgi:ribonuclease HI